MNIKPQLNMFFAVYQPERITQIMTPPKEVHKLKLIMENGLEFTGDYMQLCSNWFDNKLCFSFMQDISTDFNFNVYYKTTSEEKWKFLRTFKGQSIAYKAYQYFFQQYIHKNKAVKRVERVA